MKTSKNVKGGGGACRPLAFLKLLECPHAHRKARLLMNEIHQLNNSISFQDMRWFDSEEYITEGYKMTWNGPQKVVPKAVVALYRKP